jgi:hypothetical protein
MDVFTWSLPFVSEKVVEILFNVLMKGAKDHGIEAKDVLDGEKEFELVSISYNLFAENYFINLFLNVF